MDLVRPGDLGNRNAIFDRQRLERLAGADRDHLAAGRRPAIAAALGEDRLRRRSRAGPRNRARGGRRAGGRGQVGFGDRAVAACDRGWHRLARADDLVLVLGRAGEEGIPEAGCVGTAAGSRPGQDRRHGGLREKPGTELNHSVTHLLELATRTLPMPRVNTGNVDKAFNQSAAME